MTSKECTLGTVFCQPWWLDVVAPGQWAEVRVEKGGQLQARLPYVYRETPLGLQIRMPPLTQTLGPCISRSEGKLTRRLGRENDLQRALIEGLPKFVSFRQNFSYSVEYWLPWHWSGFTQTTRITYVLEDLNNLEEVFQQFDQKVRTDIRKAEKSVRAMRVENIELFLPVHRKVFDRQGMRLPYTDDLVRRLDAAAEARGCRAIFLAMDERDRVHAAVYLVWDSDSAYYLMGGGDPELRSSGATSLCMWEAIKFAATVTRKFDFEGSMLEPVERFFRGFGARPIAYSTISKETTLWRVLQFARSRARSFFQK